MIDDPSAGPGTDPNADLNPNPDPNPDPNADPNADPGTPAPWYLAEGVQGVGDMPDYFKFDKYQNLSEQAKAYKDLESQFGSFTGAPKDGYQVNLSEDVTNAGIEINKEDPLYEEAIKFAGDNQMNQEGFDSMMNLYATAKIADVQALDKYKEDQIAGMDNGQARVNNLIAWGKANLSEELFKGFEDMPTSAEAVLSLEHIIGMTQAQSITPNGGSGSDETISAEELTAMQFEKDEYGNRRLSTDPAFRAKFDDLMKKKHGSQDHNIIVGA